MKEPGTAAGRDLWVTLQRQWLHRDPAVLAAPLRSIEREAAAAERERLAAEIRGWKVYYGAPTDAYEDGREAALQAVLKLLTEESTAWPM